MSSSQTRQRIKNRNDTGNALKGLRRVRSWALTGTPIENHEEERDCPVAGQPRDWGLVLEERTRALLEEISPSRKRGTG